jgi:hypothetical protein
VDVHGRGRDDHLEVLAPGQQLLHETQDDVDADGALVGLVDDQAGVVRQQRVLGDLVEHQPVELEDDSGCAARLSAS